MKSRIATVVGFLKVLPCPFVVAGQGLYYLLTGMWPMVHLGSFLIVTGPKDDLWLVRTAGLLIAVIGGTLLFSALRFQVVPEIMFLAIGSALALGGIDIYYVLKGQIPMMYLLDALMEIVWLLPWVSCSRTNHSARS
jgi:hypothetical protein